MNEIAVVKKTSKLEAVLRWALYVDPAAARADAEALRARHPDEAARQLARRIYRGLSWRAASVGLAAGLPSNLLVAVPAGALESATLLRWEVEAASRVGLLYDPSFLDDEEAVWEVLLPIMARGAVSQALRELGVAAGKELTRRAIRGVLCKGTLRAFKRLALKWFGVRVTQRVLITKTVPVVGGVVGGLWNLGQVRANGRRVIAYFE